MKLPVSLTSRSVTGMEPLFCDHEKEIQEILEKGREAIRDGEDDGESALPQDLCLRLSPTLGYKVMTGFPVDTLQMIVERAIPFIKTGTKCGVKRNECVMLALVWFRSGGMSSSLPLMQDSSTRCA